MPKIDMVHPGVETEAGPSRIPLDNVIDKQRPCHSEGSAATKKLKRANYGFANSPVSFSVASPGTAQNHDFDPRIAQARSKLPITSVREAIIQRIRDNETVILLADTGSGKSTQIPQFLHHAGFTSSAPMRMIGITQPRRMAAISLAKRVAQEMETSDPGEDDGARQTDSEKHSTVGFAIRFQDRTTKHTRIKFMTDGWLLREFVRAASYLLRDDLDLDDVTDPNHASLLPQYSVLIIDEAHERSVRTDLVLGLAKRIQRRRRELRRQWEHRAKAGLLSAHDLEPQLLRLVIMSATLDAKLFVEFFSAEGEQAIDGVRDSGARSDRLPEDDMNNIVHPQTASSAGHSAPVLYVKGRTYPVKVHHLIEPAADWIDAARRQILQLHVFKPLGADNGGGDILVFGTGAEEIETLTGSLRQLGEHLEQWAAEQEKISGKRHAVGKLLVVPLYAALGNKAVIQVFKPTPPSTRKVVVATNIAETSVTIPGIRFVVDCGLAKEKMHIAHSNVTRVEYPAVLGSAAQISSSAGMGIETLTTRPISKSAAAQRAGRAGREATGECFRLYPLTEYDAMEQTTVPEIHRTELTSVALDCYSAGVDPREVDWVDAPNETKLGAAIFELASIGAVKSQARGRPDNGRERPHQLVLTDLGRKMSSLPLPPRFSHFLIVASQTSSPQTVTQARDLVAILSSERSVFAEPTASVAAAELAAGNDKETHSGNVAEHLEERRSEAEKAKSQFRHRSGDHVTLLRAFHRFMQVRRAIESEYESLQGRPGVGGPDGPEGRLRSWCTNHFISLRAMREIEDIRTQITGICQRAGIPVADNDDDEGPDGHLPSEQRRQRHVEEEEATASEGDDDPLLVVRGSKKSSKDDLDDEVEDDYHDLRRCLVAGRSTANLAIRTSEMAGTGGNTTTYKVLCGCEVFKLHPTSSLHPRNLSEKSATPPKLIVFEELQYTTQLYVRTATEVDIEWVQEAARKYEERDGGGRSINGI